MANRHPTRRFRFYARTKAGHTNCHSHAAASTVSPAAAITTLRARLVDRLEQAIRQEADPAARYEALRVGLMLSAPSQLRRAFLVRHVL